MFKDCGIGGKDEPLRNDFASILIANGGKPWTAALFSQRSDDREQLRYYFSPDASRLAAPLLQQYGAVPCEAPPCPTIENLLSLSVGDGRSRELLWPQESRNS